MKDNIFKVFKIAHKLVYPIYNRLKFLNFINDKITLKNKVKGNICSISEAISRNRYQIIRKFIINEMINY